MRFEREAMLRNIVFLSQFFSLMKRHNESHYLKRLELKPNRRKELPPEVFNSEQFTEYKQKCMDMAENIDKWYDKNIVGVGFENDDDFENLK